MPPAVSLAQVSIKLTCLTSGHMMGGVVGCEGDPAHRQPAQATAAGRRRPARWSSGQLRHHRRLRRPHPSCRAHAVGGRIQLGVLARFTEQPAQTKVELGESLPVETATVTALLPEGVTAVPVTLTTAWRNETELDGFWQWTLTPRSRSAGLPARSAWRSTPCRPT